jgi:hypothetical protein
MNNSFIWIFDRYIIYNRNTSNNNMDDWKTSLSTILTRTQDNLNVRPRYDNWLNRPALYTSPALPQVIETNQYSSTTTIPSSEQVNNSTTHVNTLELNHQVSHSLVVIRFINSVACKSESGSCNCEKDV